MKILLGIIFTVIPAFSMAVPIVLFNLAAGIVIFVMVLALGASIWFGTDENWRQL